MKTTLIAATLLALPVAAAATIAMEPQQAMQPSHEQALVYPQPAHHQLFTVKYVLHLAPPDSALPDVTIDRSAPVIAPSMGGAPVVTIGSLPSHPNMLVCYGWGCQEF